MKCPECNGTSFDSDGSCRSCGLVSDDAPIESEYSTQSEGTLPVNGRIVKEFWCLSTRQKNLYRAQKLLNLASSRLMLPSLVEKDAYYLFRTAVEKDLNIGRDNFTLLYASIYAACIIHGIPKTPFEAIAFTEVSKSKMLNMYRELKERLNIAITPDDPTDFVHRFGSRLSLRQET